MSKYSHPKKHTVEQVLEVKRMLETAARAPKGGLKRGEIDRIVTATGVSRATVKSIRAGVDWEWVAQ